MKELTLANSKCDKETKYLIDFQIIIKQGDDMPMLKLNNREIEINEYKQTDEHGHSYIHIKQHFTADKDFKLVLEYEDSVNVDTTTIKLTEE